MSAQQIVVTGAESDSSNGYEELSTWREIVVLSNQELRAMTPPELMERLGDLPDYDIELNETLYRQVQSELLGKRATTASEQIEYKCPVDCASQIISHLQSYRAGIVENGADPGEATPHFKKTFDVTNVFDIDIHDEFLRRLRVDYAEEAQFRPTVYTGLLRRAPKLFAKKVIVAGFDDIAIIRTGVLDAADRPYFLNYEAVRYGEDT